MDYLFTGRKIFAINRRALYLHIIYPPTPPHSKKKGEKKTGKTFTGHKFNLIKEVYLPRETWGEDYNSAAIPVKISKYC